MDVRTLESTDSLNNGSARAIVQELREMETISMQGLQQQFTCYVLAQSF